MTALASATVIGPSLTYADAFATTIFVKGTSGLRWLQEQHPEYDGFIVDGGQTLVTERFPRHIAVDHPTTEASTSINAVPRALHVAVEGDRRRAFIMACASAEGSRGVGIPPTDGIDVRGGSRERLSDARLDRRPCTDVRHTGTRRAPRRMRRTPSPA